MTQAKHGRPWGGKMQRLQIALLAMIALSGIVGILLQDMYQEVALQDEPRFKPVPLPISSLSTSVLTFVLVSSSADVNGWPRIRLLVGSMIRFAHPRCIRELLIVVPPSDEEEMLTQVLNGFGLESKPQFEIRVVNDSTVLGRSERKQYERLTPRAELIDYGGRGTGYRIAMLLKLGVAQLLKTSFYVTLDSDVFLKRPVAFRDLISDGKALLQGGRGQQHESWWQSSFNLLQPLSKQKDTESCSVNEFSKDFSIGVTPSILSTEISLDLLKVLDSGPGWDLALFSALNNRSTKDWTEYTLYWVWACMSGLAHKKHVRFLNRKLYSEDGFSVDDLDVLKWSVEEMFNDETTLFGVVQSIDPVPYQDVVREVEPYVGISR